MLLQYWSVITQSVIPWLHYRSLLRYIISCNTMLNHSRTSDDAVREHHDVNVWWQRWQSKAERRADGSKHGHRTTSELVHQSSSQRC